MKVHRLDRRGFVASLASIAALPACGSDDNSGGSGTGGAGGSAGAGGSSGTSGAGGSGGAPGLPGPEPPTMWAAPGTEDLGAFAWGVQAGDATPDSVLLSVRSTEPSVTLTVMRGTDSGWEEVASGESFGAADEVVQLELADLASDTTYSYAFYSADGARRSRVGRFRTALSPGASRAIRFGSTSCLGGAGRPWPSMSQSTGEKLDFFLLLGDTVYADGSITSEDYLAHWKTALSTTGLIDATAGTSVIATWDDHEVDNDWSWLAVTQAQFDAALSRYRQGLPQRTGPGGTGIWRKLSWGAAMDLFVLDSRGERRDGNYISVEQMTWLKTELAASTATFKVILNSVPIFDFTGTVVAGILAGDRWQGFPAQRSELVGHVRDAGVTGVLWVSGDFHIGGVGLIDGPGGPGDDQYEVLTGPAGSNINPAAGLLQPDARILSIVGAWNYVIFEADPATGIVGVRFIGDDGSVISESSLQIA